MMRDIDVIKTVKLKRPIPVMVNVDGKLVACADEIKEVKIGVIKGKHLEFIPASLMVSTGPGGGKRKRFPMNPAEFLPLIAAITELTLETVKEMEINDILTVAEAITEAITLPE